jgi:SPP1 family predicted phage head-tail adaptor
LTTTENEFGELIETFTDIAIVWGEKIELRGAERYASMQTTASVDCKFRIRYRTDLTAMNRIACDGKEYNVQGVLELGRREGLEILAARSAD